MALYDQATPTTPWPSVNAGVIPPDVYGVSINQFLNRAPLYTRLPKLPCGSDSFFLTNDNYRPRSVPIAANYTTTGTTLTFADATSFDVGDVLNVDSEFFLVTGTAASNSGTTVITVAFAYAGSTNAAHSSGATAYLITNTRTGAEINISAISRIPATNEQYCQTVQHAVQVGGSLEANANYVSGMGSTPLDRDRNMTMQHCVDDFEEALYYGVGVKRAGTSTRPAMKGLSTLIVTNRTTSPTSASAYKASDFQRDTVSKCFSGAGQPNLLIVSPEFQTAFSVWGQPCLRLEAGANIFGTAIDLFAVSFLPNIPIIVAPLLRPYSAFCLSMPEVRIRMKRKLIEKPRGSNGDAWEADMIMEGAIELDNEPHHAYVTGINAFSAT